MREGRGSRVTRLPKVNYIEIISAHSGKHGHIDIYILTYNGIRYGGETVLEAGLNFVRSICKKRKTSETPMEQLANLYLSTGLLQSVEACVMPKC